MHRRTTRAAAATSALLVSTGLLAACSMDSGSSSDLVQDAQAQTTVTVAPSTPVSSVQANYDALPTAADGTVTIEGIADELTAFERAKFNSSGTDTFVQRSTTSADTAYAKLCSGDIDIADTYTAMTNAQIKACQANGLDVVQFEVAADALVVAIKNETDVGGDCLSMSQLAEIYRAGSPITEWSQVGDGFYDTPLEAIGAPYGDDRFTWFAQTVLGTDNPAKVTFRSDYVSFDTDKKTRLEVVGNTSDETLAAEVRTYQRQVQQYTTYIRSQRGVVADARSEVRKAAKEVAKGVRTGRDAATQKSDRQRLSTAKKKLAREVRKLDRLLAEQASLTKSYAKSKAAAKRVEALTGRVAYLGYSYYQVFENELRPFEITEDGTENCVFPSAVTITDGQYPLSRPYLLTTTQRSLDRDEVQEFLLYYLDNALKDVTSNKSNTGLSVQNRLVTVTSDQIKEQRGWVTGRLDPTYLEADGTTSTASASDTASAGASASASATATTSSGS
ncbi:hypothetical protein [Nocardioides sp. GY 10127]|uniref:PstS family phosphate ABC transporter substrate-binding protein n=1 Tax=Nocardioides sp. GY 10127 TaxID=2569762 RepID=UPI0010A764EE|nr:hypothetical protein [Nocardioides sp. GY 10127]TIC79937.1 hypothetical protein E8D37_14925 [Nocardioides sp. GY 10127]